MPILAAESDVNKRKLLQDRATTYLERAEKIKQSFIDAYGQQKCTMGANEQAETSSVTTENPVKQALNSNVSYKQLCE